MKVTQRPDPLTIKTLCPTGTEYSGNQSMSKAKDQVAREPWRRLSPPCLSGSKGRLRGSDGEDNQRRHGIRGDEGKVESRCNVGIEHGHWQPSISAQTDKAKKRPRARVTAAGFGCNLQVLECWFGDCRRRDPCDGRQPAVDSGTHWIGQARR